MSIFGRHTAVDSAPRRVLSASIAALLLAAGLPAAKAANATWTGAADSLWATAANWTATPVPGPGHTATFNSSGNGRTILSLGSGVTVGGLLFDSAGVAAYTIGSGAVGSQTLTLDNGGSISVGATVGAAQTINAGVVLGTSTAASTQTISNQSPAHPLTIAGGISRSGTSNVKTLAVTGSGNTNIHGAIGGGAIAIAKTGDGMLTLTNANTFTGAVTIYGGILRITNGGALGATAGGVTTGLPNGLPGALQLDGGVTVGNEPLSLGGGLPAGATGQLESLSGVNTYGGLLTLLVPAAGFSYELTVAARTGSTLHLTNTGAITGNSTLRLTGGGSGSISSLIGASVAGLIKSGTGTWTLAGNSAAFVGPVTVSEGTLRLSGAGRLGTTSLELRMSGGTLDLGGTSQTVGAIGANGSAFGTILNNGGGASVLTFGSGNADGLFEGTILDHDNASAGTVALTKVGTGSFSLGAANSYSGATLINAGTFTISHSAALGSTAGGTTVASGATLTLGGNLAVGEEPLRLAGTGAAGQGGALVSNGNNVFGGLLTLTGGTTIRSASGTLDLPHPGAITGATFTLTLAGDGSGTLAGSLQTGSGGVTKSGAGKWTLSGASSFGGVLTINAGIVNLQNDAAAGSTAAGIVMSGGATLQLQGGVAIGAEPLTLRGTGAPGTTGALQNVSGNNTFGGRLTLGADSVISSDAGTLTLNSANSVTGASLDLTLTGAGDGVLTSAIGTGSGLVTKSGAGTWTLSGLSTFTGTLAVAAGTLAIPTINHASTNGPLGNSAAPVQLGSAAGPGTLRYTGASAASTKPVQILAGGGGLTVTQAATQLTLSGGLSGNGALLKSGPGTLVLTGTNSFSGAVGIEEGTLRLAAASALAASSGVTVQGGATLELAGGGNRIGDAVPLTLDGGTFAIAGLTGQTETLGVLAVTAPATIDFGSGSGFSLLFAGLGAPAAGARLAITGWSGTIGQAGTAASDRLIFGGATSAAFSAAFAQGDVSFNGVAGYLAIQIDSARYEIVAVPEPQVWSLLAVGVALGLAGHRRRR